MGRLDWELRKGKEWYYLWCDASALGRARVLYWKSSGQLLAKWGRAGGGKQWRGGRGKAGWNKWKVEEGRVEESLLL